MSILAEKQNRFGIGANNPPSPIEAAGEMTRELASFLADNPVLASETIAREAAGLAKRAATSLAEMEQDRTTRTKPLNEQLAALNNRYRSPRTILERVVAELKARLTAFAQVEEARRAAEAAEKRRAAEEAERLAREAEAAEREALDNAAQGELGIDVAAVTVAADQAFADLQRAGREASRAERDVGVKLGTGYGRAVAMRAKETLVLTDPAAAIAAIGLTDGIREAVLTAARAYRKLKDGLPPGVVAETERRM